MRALHIKLRRDLWRMRGQVITITLILASGIAAYVTLAGTHRALATSRDAYYARHGFPDVFVHLERAPDAVAARLREIGGVADVETRLVEPVSIRIPGEVRPPAGRAISLRPASRAAAALVLRQGRPLEVGRDDEALVLETFARANNLAPGDALTLVIGGHELELRIAGLVLSPEWIFPAESGGTGLGDFGVVWMTADGPAPGAGQPGAFGRAPLPPGPVPDRRTVIEAIDRVLARWGGGGAFGRDRQASNKAVAGELDQLEVMATQVPAVFLLVAVFLLNVVLSRIVHLQREQLAVLRALGYTRGALARHVLALAAVITIAGVAVGLALGRWFAGVVTALYGTFFHFPLLEVSLDARLIAVSVIAAVVAAGGGATTAAYRVVRMAPAEAMRPPSPARYRRGPSMRGGPPVAPSLTGRCSTSDRPASRPSSRSGLVPPEANRATCTRGCRRREKSRRSASESTTKDICWGSVCLVSW